MDGTLVDSTAVVERVWRGFADRNGIDIDRILAVSHGRRTAETLTLFTPPGFDIAGEAARLTAEEVADVAGIRPVVGAAALLAALPPGRWAMVTSAGRELAERRMIAAGLPLPPVVVTADDVTDGKPSPEGYLAAARTLGFAPSECLVLEDAPAGLQAGRAAGAQVLAVATTLGGPALDGETWVPDFAGVRVEIRRDGMLSLQIGG